VSRFKRALEITLLASSTYVLSHPQELKADAYCDAYIEGCFAGLAEWCEDTWYAGCESTNHNNKHCDCGS
jgi:hypothetical protein